MRYLNFSIAIIVISFILFYSCVKESHLDLNYDTTKIALIIQPDQVTGKDVVIESIVPDHNFSNTSFFSVFSWTTGGSFNTSRALLEFDLSSIPVQTQIDSAELSLFWSDFEDLDAHAGNNAFSIYKITEPWNESNVTWNNQPTISTTKIVSLPKSNFPHQSFLNINVNAIIQEMISNPSENHGFMIKLDEEVPYKMVLFASCEHVDATKRPKLVIYF